MNIQYLTIIVTGILIIVSILREKSIISPAFMFFCLWFFILFLDSFHLYGLRVTSDRIYIMIALGIVTFALGYYLNDTFGRNKRIIVKIGNGNSDKDASYWYRPRYNIIYALVFVTIIYYLREFSVVLQYLLSGDSLAIIRKLAQDSSSVLHMSRSGIWNAISILIVIPFTTILQPIVVSDFFWGRKDKKLLALNFLLIFMRTVSDGSRTLLIYMGISFIICFFFDGGSKKLREKFAERYKSHKQKKKNRVIFIGLFAVLLFVIYKVTMSRSGENAIRYTYYYFSMQPQMFEIWADKVDASSLYGYGMAALNGFAFAFFYLTSHLVGISSDFWREIYIMLESTGTSWQAITISGTTANSFVSAFWVFYLDAREIGVGIGMFIYGILVSRVFIRMKKSANPKNISLFIMWYIGLFYTFVRFQFSNIYYCVAMLQLSFLVFQKTKERG